MSVFVSAAGLGVAVFLIGLSVFSIYFFIGGLRLYSWTLELGQARSWYSMFFRAHLRAKIRRASANDPAAAQILHCWEMGLNGLKIQAAGLLIFAFFVGLFAVAG